MIPAQIRCGRAALNMTQKEFAELCGLARTTITQAEMSTDVTRRWTIDVIFRVLKSKGIHFRIVGNSFSMKCDPISFVARKQQV